MSMRPTLMRAMVSVSLASRLVLAPFAVLVVTAAPGPATAAEVAPAPTMDLAERVDPLIGTDNTPEVSRGNTYPAAVWPFGMVTWTPQTAPRGRWIYRLAENQLVGLRATHSPHVWMTDYGPFALMPMSDRPIFDVDARAAGFKREDEAARPYSYAVKLQGSGISAEVVPGPRSGLLRFVFPKAVTIPIVLLDAFEGGSHVRLLEGGQRIVGWNAQARKGTPAEWKTHFVLLFDRRPSGAGTWDGKATKELGAAKDAGSAEATADHTGAYVRFASTPGAATEVRVRVGTSFISAAQAELNLRRELPEPDLEAARSRARAAWNRELGRIRVEGADDDAQVSFYSAMYQALQYPRVVHEPDLQGRVRHRSPYDGRVHDGPMFTDTGFWDTYRAQFPLLSVINQEKYVEIINGMISAYEQSGWIPKWPNPGHTDVMIGTHGDAVIGDAWVKGLRGFDAAKAYEAIRKNATTDGDATYEARQGLPDYVRLGYVPADKLKESVSITLEGAFDDFCVAQVAKGLGKAEDHATFLRRSLNYRNVFDRATGFMRGRNADGTWAPLDPLAWGGPYTEGNAHQYSWSVQHDVPGMVELFGGPAAVAARLDRLFALRPTFALGGYKRTVHEMREHRMASTGQYAHINEPVHHVIYLYAHVGQPWKTQRWAREIMNRLYGRDPQGRLGDEDNGQMSAWLIWSALGLYPVTPCQPLYTIGSPLFPRATITLESGKTFTVEAPGHAEENVYVQSATLGGRPIDRAWLRHDELMAGGVLSLRMGPAPNPRWGRAPFPPADRDLARLGRGLGRRDAR